MSPTKTKLDKIDERHKLLISELLKNEVSMIKIVDKNVVHAMNLVKESIMENLDDIARDQNKTIFINIPIHAIHVSTAMIDRAVDGTVTVTSGRLGTIIPQRGNQPATIKDISQVDVYLTTMTRYLMGEDLPLGILPYTSSIKKQKQPLKIPMADEIHVISVIPVSYEFKNLHDFAGILSNIPKNIRTLWNVDHPDKEVEDTVQEIVSKSVNNTIRSVLNLPDLNHTIVFIRQDSVEEFVTGVPVVVTTKNENTYVQEEAVSSISKLKDAKLKTQVGKTVFADLETTSVVNSIDTSYKLDRIAGYEFIKDFVRTRAKLLKNEKAVREHNIQLKGLFLLGVPGTGKSTIAKCVGNELGIPAYELNIEAAFNKHFGTTEGKIQSTLDLLERLGRVAVVIDEIDKLFAGVATGTTGNDVPVRIFGMLLKHMAKEDSNILFIATANDMNLPASFTRKGRFDKVFFVDVPTAQERKLILEYYIKKFKANQLIDEKILNSLVVQTENWTGSDLETLVKEVTIARIVNPKKKNNEIIEEIMTVLGPSIKKPEIEKMREIGSTYADNMKLV